MDFSDPVFDPPAQMAQYWEAVRLEIEGLKADHIAFKTQDLPLARIKKIMKLDDDIRTMMISAEAPILFAKAAELFIRELTLRAWIHTERNRRRTLQRNDIAMAVSDGDTDQFDFLIDIVPREETRGHRRQQNSTSLQRSPDQSMTLPGGAVVAASGTTPPPGTSTTNTVVIQQASTDEIDATTMLKPEASTTTSSASYLTGTNGLTLLTDGGDKLLTNGTMGGQVQYHVVQLPAASTSSSATATGQTAVVGSNGGAPLQIQFLPQASFQTGATTDSTLGSAATTTLLTDASGNSIPVVQMASQATGAGGQALTLPIIQDANGRHQLIQLQNQPTTTFVLQQPQLEGQQLICATSGLDGGSADVNSNLQTVYHLPANSSFLVASSTDEAGGQTLMACAAEETGDLQSQTIDTSSGMIMTTSQSDIDVPLLQTTPVVTASDLVDIGTSNSQQLVMNESGLLEHQASSIDHCIVQQQDVTSMITSQTEETSGTGHIDNLVNYDDIDDDEDDQNGGVESNDNMGEPQQLMDTTTATTNDISSVENQEEIKPLPDTLPG